MDLSQIDLSKMSPEDKEELFLILSELDKYKNTNKIEYFNPYKFQDDFYKAGKTHNFRFLCAANRIGKSFSEAQEVAFHITGQYPDWWEGRTFDYPILCWCVGITGESTRKVLQKELFGTDDARDVKSIGTGAIPKKCIDFESLARDGQRILSCRIRHRNSKGMVDGYSTLEFRSTQQGEAVLMGATVDYIWLD